MCQKCPHVHILAPYFQEIRILLMCRVYTVYIIHYIYLRKCLMLKKWWNEFTIENKIKMPISKIFRKCDADSKVMRNKLMCKWASGSPPLRSAAVFRHPPTAHFRGGGAIALPCAPTVPRVPIPSHRDNEWVSDGSLKILIGTKHKAKD